jgi:hypothetical protein
MCARHCQSVTHIWQSTLPQNILDESADTSLNDSAGAKVDMLDVKDEMDSVSTTSVDQGASCESIRMAQTNYRFKQATYK